MSLIDTDVGLGIDAGGTATRWVLLAKDHQVIARGEARSMSGHVLTDAGRLRMKEAIGEIKEGVGFYRLPTKILAGITGVSAGSESSKSIIEFISDQFDLPIENVCVTTDLWISYQSYYRPGQGILVYCGTGSAAIHINKHMVVFRAGGFGHLIDDAGSGYAIGRDAVKAVLRAEDMEPGGGWSTALGRRLAKRLGGPSWAAVRKCVYNGDRSALSLLAPLVGEAATYDGDSVAEKILLNAGADLAELAKALRHRLGKLPVGLAGRAATIPLVAKGMSHAIGEEISIRVTDAAITAADLALSSRFQNIKE